MNLIESPLQIIQAIQKANQLLNSEKSNDHKFRLELLDRLISAIRSSSEAISESDLNSADIKSLSAYHVQICDRLNLSGVNRGADLVSIVLPQNAFLRMALEFVMESLASGNLCLVKMSQWQKELALELLKILVRAKIADAYCQVVCGSAPEMKEILVSHPSIKKVVFIGKKKNFQKISQSSEFLNKRWMASFGGTTSSLLLDSADLHLFVREFLAQYQSQRKLSGPMTCHRIYIIESRMTELLAVLQEQSQLLSLENYFSEDDFESIHNKCEKLLFELKQESANLSFDGATSAKDFQTLKPIIFRDLPNCSTLHQSEWDLPVFLVGSVKYPYELSKWVNNDSAIFGVQIFGDHDKVASVASKLVVGNVMANRWIHTISPMPLGKLQGQFGFSDRNIDGQFW